MTSTTCFDLSLILSDCLPTGPAYYSRTAPVPLMCDVLYVTGTTGQAQAPVVGMGPQSPSSPTWCIPTRGGWPRPTLTSTSNRSTRREGLTHPHGLRATQGCPPCYRSRLNPETQAMKVVSSCLLVCSTNKLNNTVDKSCFVLRKCSW